MRKILLVEDEKFLAEMYIDKLIEAGFEVIHALESKEALGLVNSERPDLVVLDILLPREDGIYFLRQLRKNEDKKIAATPVLAFSNFDDPDTKKEAHKLQVKAYLIKTSYTPQELVRQIEKYI